jgi:hypothetical protein
MICLREELEIQINYAQNRLLESPFEPFSQPNVQPAPQQWPVGARPPNGLRKLRPFDF